MATRKDLRRAVDRGVHYLDRHHEGWWQHCQLSTYTLTRFAPDKPWSWLRTHGFAPGDDDVVGEQRALLELWKVLIAGRRLQLDRPQEPPPGDPVPLTQKWEKGKDGTTNE